MRPARAPVLVLGWVPELALTRARVRVRVQMMARPKETTLRVSAPARWPTHRSHPMCLHCCCGPTRRPPMNQRRARPPPDASAAGEWSATPVRPAAAGPPETQGSWMRRRETSAIRSWGPEESGKRRTLVARRRITVVPSKLLTLSNQFGDEPAACCNLCADRAMPNAIAAPCRPSPDAARRDAHMPLAQARVKLPANRRIAAPARPGRRLNTCDGAQPPWRTSQPKPRLFCKATKSFTSKA
ncbi:hypothetical protein SAMN05216359_10948 [Roseateles sp. YR242]|nr:hypothetical protein SAMN05216359_10948 [Roseateles sp. YR242]